ncbi:hypothetical protein C9927_04660, partial [Pseudidiomarina aestuarii]
YDIRAVRIITRSLKDCYAALGVVHSLFRHIASEFDDYIATPKANGYQSIHTVVAGPAGKHIEIQIRTQTMHDDAELGVAAHWLYKEGSTAGKGHGFEEKIAWLRKLLAWQEDMAENDELVAEIRSQVFEDRVKVYTQMNRNSVRTRLFCQCSSSNRIGIRYATCIANCCYMVNIHTQQNGIMFRYHVLYP